MMLLFLIACRPDLDYASHAEQARQTCGWEAAMPDTAWLDPNAPLTYPSEVCVDRVLADFSVETADFLAADGLDDPYGYVRGDGSLDGARLSFVLGAARGLLTLDFGAVADLEASPQVSADYVRTLGEVSEQTGASDLGAALYDFASTVITSSRPLDEDGGRGSFQADTRTLVVRDGLREGWAPGVVLVHEARHYWGGHGECSTGEGSCDEDATLAHGFGLSSMVALYDALPEDADPAWRAYLIERIHTQMRHIETFLDEDGALLPEWEQWP